MTEEMRFETVKDLIEYVIKNRPDGSKRWLLGKDSSHDFADRQAGRVWQAEYDLVCHTWAGKTHSDEAKVAFAEIENRRPAILVTYKYYLIHYYPHNYRSDRIYLSAALYEAMEAVWPTTTTYSGRKQPVHLGLKGILNRLANADEIDAAKRAWNDAQAALQIATAKDRITRAAADLKAAVERAQDLGVDVSPEMTVAQLMTLFLDEAAEA